jgi:hypothetical protein
MGSRSIFPAMFVRLSRVGSFWICLNMAAGVPAETNSLKLHLAVEGPDLRLSWHPAQGTKSFTVETTRHLVPADWRSLGADIEWPTTSTNIVIPRETTGTAWFRVLGWQSYARGSVETNVLVRSYTTPELQALLEAFPVPDITPRPVEAWKMIYTTVDPHGNPTRASALLAVPVGVTDALPMVAYQHGTSILREDVPSRLNTEGLLGVILAASSYIAVLPDYLGLGDSPGLHPFHHARSEATAVVDALRAARDSIAGVGATWNGQLFLCGYSQGGHATLAAQREIERFHTNEFTITASAPSAGAYDLSGTTLNDFLSGRVSPNPYYSVYFLAACIETYALASTFAEWLREPYNTTVPPLLDGMHSGSEINAVLPANPLEILRSDVLEQIRSNPDHPFREALRENDLYSGWVPRSPTRLHHCRADADVLIANSEMAYASFHAAGAPVDLVDPWPPGDHEFCAVVALLATKFWFDDKAAR